MGAEDFITLLRTRPFVPLRIHLTDGTTYDLRHPDNVWVLRTRIEIGVPAIPGGQLLDRVEHFSLSHIVRIEQLDSPAPVGGNGG